MAAVNQIEQVLTLKKCAIFTLKNLSFALSKENQTRFDEIITVKVLFDILSKTGEPSSSLTHEQQDSTNELVQTQVLLIMRQQLNPEQFAPSGNISDDDMSSDLESPFKFASKTISNYSADSEMVLEKLLSLYVKCPATVKT